MIEINRNGSRPNPTRAMDRVVEQREEAVVRIKYLAKRIRADSVLTDERSATETLPRFGVG